MNITFENVITSIIALSVIAVIISIFVDFTLFDEKNNLRKYKKSIAATGTMAGFYGVYYMVIRLGIGFIAIGNDGMVAVGTCMIAAGSVMNIAGRLHLGGNWANHIKIYQNHSLVTTGVYKVVRHPLYASIMLMLFGGCIVYQNWLSALLTAFVFIPFMYYRAKQEESILIEEFPMYMQYKKSAGMFFPKIGIRR